MCENIANCKCGVFGMIHSKDSSYYPSFGFYRVRNEIYDVRQIEHLGRHFWAFVVDHPEDVYINMEYSTMRISMLALPLRHLSLLSTYIGIIQRFFRKSRQPQPCLKALTKINYIIF